MRAVGSFCFLLCFVVAVLAQPQGMIEGALHSGVRVGRPRLRAWLARGFGLCWRPAIPKARGHHGQALFFFFPWDEDDDEDDGDDDDDDDDDEDVDDGDWDERKYADFWEQLWRICM